MKDDIFTSEPIGDTFNNRPISLDEIINLLNEVAVRDSTAVKNLTGNKVTVNKDIVDFASSKNFATHPQFANPIIVGKSDYGDTLSIIGLLNILFPPYAGDKDGKYKGFGMISYVFDENTGNPVFLRTDKITEIMERKNNEGN